MNKIIKKIGVLGLSAAMAAAMMLPVFAADDSNNTGDSASSVDAKVAETIQNDYWTDLTACTMNGQELAVPSDLLSGNPRQFDTKVSEKIPEDFNSELNRYRFHQINTNGIDDKDANTMLTFDPYSVFAWWGPEANAGYETEWQYIQAVTKGKVPEIADEEMKKQLETDVPDLYKAYWGLDPDAGRYDLLNEGEVANRTKTLKIYGDLSRIDKNEDVCAPGDKDLGLKFTISAPWFARYMNTWIMEAIGTTPSSYPLIKMVSNTYSDEGLVFTLDIPKGVDASKITADNITLHDPSGILKIKSVTPSPLKEDEQTENKQGKLVVKVGIDNVQSQQLKAYREDLNRAVSTDKGSVSIDIKGLDIAQDAAEGVKHIRGTVSGFSALSVELNQEVPEFKNIYWRNLFYFAGQQNSEGADKLAGEDKPKQISYSFKVSKPSTPDTPYVPSTPTEPEQPKKHEVTIHEDNPTTDKPETTTKITVDDQGKVEKPAQDPVRPGYTFDGWYSDPECTIPFDFSKPITGDIHIYAKWNKNVKPQTASKVTGILLPKAIASGSSRQTVTWTPLTNVDGYYVYEANCNTPKKTYHFKKVADVKASAPRVYKQSRLKKGVAYKYYVAAYQIKNGKKKVVKKSLSVHSIAGNFMRKRVSYTNVKKVSVNKNAVTLKVGKTYRIQPSVKGVYSNCAILQKGHAAMFRYVYIKDGKNISVSSTGIVKAKKAGKCNVYVLGTNGVRAKVAVTVK